MAEPGSRRADQYLPRTRLADVDLLDVELPRDRVGRPLLFMTTPLRRRVIHRERSGWGRPTRGGGPVVGPWMLRSTSIIMRWRGRASGGARMGLVTNKSALITLGSAVAGAALAHRWFERPSSFRAQYRRRARQELAARDPVEVVTDDDLAHLPDPVATFLRATGAVGSPRSATSTRPSADASAADPISRGCPSPVNRPTATGRRRHACSTSLHRCVVSRPTCTTSSRELTQPCGSRCCRSSRS